jgi:hypothetical protein
MKGGQINPEEMRNELIIFSPPQLFLTDCSQKERKRERKREKRKKTTTVAADRSPGREGFSKIA